MPVLAFWLGLSAELRCFVVAGLGLLGGALANWMIYRFAYFNPRPISPWGPRPEGAQPRTFLDRLPVLGWFLLRREVKWHGSGFWFRPLLIEIGTAVALVSLFRFETQTGGLLPLFLRSSPFLELLEPYANQIFFTHAILFVLMVAATFIDFDERIIPNPGCFFRINLISLDQYRKINVVKRLSTIADKPRTTRVVTRSIRLTAIIARNA